MLAAEDKQIFDFYEVGSFRWENGIRMNWMRMNRIRIPISSTDNEWLIDLSPIKHQKGIAVGTTDDYLKACLESRPYRL